MKFTIEGISSISLSFDQVLRGFKKIEVAARKPHF